MLAFQPMTLPSPTPLRVCLLGFSSFEGGALASALRLATHRTPTYVTTDNATDCELVVVDADQTDALAMVVRTGLVDRAVYVGSQIPIDASGWLARPIDTKQLLHELDQLARMHFGMAPAKAANPSGLGGLSVLPAHGGPPHAGRALLVDDSEIALRFLETRLQQLGLYTERAGHSAQAVKLLSRRAFDVVFLDVELGADSEMDGLALCQHIKRHHHHAGSAAAPTVVMLSAHHSELDRARGALAGCDAYLGKPLDEDALHRVLRQQAGLVPSKY